MHAYFQSFEVIGGRALAMTNKLFVILNSIRVAKIKKILLYEMKYFVPNYSCLQNPWLKGLPPPDCRSVCPLPSTEFDEPPEQNSCLGHCIYEKVSPRQQTLAAGSQPSHHSPSSHDTVHWTHTVTWYCTLHPHCQVVLYTAPTLSHDTVHCTHTVKWYCTLHPHCHM